MRILLTGVTGRQSKLTNLKTDKIYDTKLIYKILTDLGHEVIWKRTNKQEDLSKYDICVLGLGPAASFNGVNVLNAAWIINKIPTILHFEDWQITNTLKSYQSIIDDKQSMLRNKDGITFLENAIEYKYDLDELVNNFKIICNLNEHPDIKVIIPGFKWGDKSIVHKVLKTTNVTPFDLTPLVITKDFYNKPLWTDDKPKIKKHLLATLGDHSKWVKSMNLKWDVITSDKGKAFESEVSVFNATKQYWSCLAPEYDHSGSGWFRARFMYAALADSVMVCSNKDAEHLGVSFMINPETLSIDDLTDVAKKQRQIIESYRTTYEELKQTFYNLI